MSHVVLNTTYVCMLLGVICKSNGMQKKPCCKKEVRPSKVESYLKMNAWLKDECMVWLTTRGDIWMRPRLKY